MFHKTYFVTKIFTNSGIYMIDDNSILKLQIIDKPIQHNKEQFIIDNSEFIFIKQVYQLPYHYHKEIYKIHTILVNQILKIYLNIEISKNQPPEFYFYIDNKDGTPSDTLRKVSNKKDDNLDNILDNISTFLSSYNFIECI